MMLSRVSTGIIRFSHNALVTRVTPQYAVQKRLLFEEKYNAEEAEKILKILNDSRVEDDFKKFIISSKRIGELIKLREAKGEFKNLDDLIPIMGIKILEKFYGSMLEKKSLGLGNPMVPTLSPDKIAAYSNVLSFNITGNRLSWSLITRLKNSKNEPALHLHSLHIRAFELTPKTHFLNLLHQMTELAQELPPCDLCICEEYPSQVPSTYLFSFYLQMTQVRSMFLGYLAAQSNPPQIISLKTVAVARLFNTYIGSEKVSGQHVVDAMFENSNKLGMDSRLRHYYLDADSQTKEYLSNVFLVNLAYWKLTSQFEDATDKTA